MKHSIFSAFCFVFLITACSNPSAMIETKNIEVKTTRLPMLDSNTVRLSITKIDSVLAHIKPGQKFEFMDIYSDTTTLGDRQSDTVFIDKFILKRGFKQSQAGWGNWMFGPHMLALKYEKGDSVFHIAKFHYSEKYTGVKVTETLELSLK